MEPEFRKQLTDLLRDKKSGSSLLSKRVREILSLIPVEDQLASARAILKSHGSMASIINAVNLHFLEREGHPITIPPYLPNRIQDFWQMNRARIIWCTLSMSHWVIQTLKAAPQPLELFIGISNPQKEGRLTHQHLRESHPATILEDTHLCSMVEHCDGILLGADVITEVSVVNKMGSKALAIAANYYQKPLYIVSSGDKYLSNNLQPFYSPKGTQRKSRMIQYFEPIPMELVTHICLTSDKWEFPASTSLKQIF